MAVIGKDVFYISSRSLVNFISIELTPKSPTTPESVFNLKDASSIRSLRRLVGHGYLSDVNLLVGLVPRTFINLASAETKVCLT
jgi:hypothetical protein